MSGKIMEIILGMKYNQANIVIIPSKRVALLMLQLKLIFTFLYILAKI